MDRWIKDPSRGKCEVECELGIPKVQPGHHQGNPLQCRRQAECRPVDHRMEDPSHGREQVVVGSSEEGRLEEVGIGWMGS